MCNQVQILSSSDISREGLAHFLRSDGFEILASGRVAGDVSSTEKSFLVVVDEPDTTLQSETVGEIKANSASAMPVVLAERFDLNSMTECFMAGAQGYIVKSIRSQPLVTALRLAAQGERVMPSDLVDALDFRSASKVSQARSSSEMNAANLSPRERDVLCCLMAGYPNKTIARQLDVCEATVKVHVKAILRKLKVRNRTQAAIWASSNGMIEAAGESH
ncbi:response regulator transcription factor [Novosphingobium sp.]|uniref:response regulator transcription factor n=1 Tax=Novosphingobium sp. TaxID=1874826 RepID=UPI0025D84321|nr:response regulator transcription factor [Novosphingobium sp.]